MLYGTKYIHAMCLSKFSTIYNSLLDKHGVVINKQEENHVKIIV